MSFVTPLALLGLGVALPAVVWIHRHVVRSPVRPVSSLHLWLGPLEQQAEGTERRRPPPTWLLLVELVIAALLGVAIAGPHWLGAAGVQRQVGVVVDLSASMGGGPEGQTGLDGARAVLEAQRRRGLRVRLVGSGVRPRVLADGDVAEALAALGAVAEEQIQRNRVAVAVVMDSSCSMGATVAAGQTKMELAGEAAAQAVDLLSAQDEVALLTVDTVAFERVRMQPLGTASGRQRILDEIRRVGSGGGGIYIEVGLTAAIKVLLEDARASNRHILLFSDAADSEQPGDASRMLDQWRGSGGTLSAVGLGQPTDADGPLLDGLASIGGGRVFFTDDPTRLPAIFAQDIMQVSRSGFVKEPRVLQAAAGLRELGFAAEAWPAVGGFHRTRLAVDATLMLAVSDEEELVPAMAGWRRGVGRVVAIPWEVAGEHTGPEVLAWPAYKDLLRSVLEWTRRSGAPHGVAARVSVARGRAEITVELDPDRAFTEVPTATMVTPDQGVVEVPLRWVGPDELVGAYELEESGLHAPRVAVAGRPAVALPPLVQPYSPEHALGAMQDGGAVLDTLAAATGGQLYVDGSGARGRRGGRRGRRPDPVGAGGLVAALPGRHRAAPGVAGSDGASGGRRCGPAGAAGTGGGGEAASPPGATDGVLLGGERRTGAATR